MQKIFCLDTLQGAKVFGGGGGAKAQISHISKSTALEIKIFSPIDSATPVSFLSAIHYVALTPLFFELFSKTILHVLHAGVSWPNQVHYPLHAPKLRLSEPVHTVAAWYCYNITVPPHCPNFALQLSGIRPVRESVGSGVSLRSRSVNDQAMDECKFAAEMKGNVLPTMKRRGDKTHSCRSPATWNGFDCLPFTRTQTSGLQ